MTCRYRLTLTDADTGEILIQTDGHECMFAVTHDDREEERAWPPRYDPLKAPHLLRMGSAVAVVVWEHLDHSWAPDVAAMFPRREP